MYSVRQVLYYGRCDVLTEMLRYKRPRFMSVCSDETAMAFPRGSEKPGGLKVSIHATASQFMKGRTRNVDFQLMDYVAEVSEQTLWGRYDRERTEKGCELTGRKVWTRYDFKYGLLTMTESDLEVEKPARVLQSHTWSLHIAHEFVFVLLFCMDIAAGLF
ncbi:hypothetical protein F2P81_003787 [Scophthalmus maximus]|uniref:Uncharacterized protein n=1 Tax=Scophthalmus maximus TaxID=52904 RepID=A0A6A4TIF6_SCOMX|nr:hypothetical protein F2P81_003787 [Scophthalmus maximus]